MEGSSSHASSVQLPEHVVCEKKRRKSVAPGLCFELESGDVINCKMATRGRFEFEIKRLFSSANLNLIAKMDLGAQWKNIRTCIFFLEFAFDGVLFIYLFSAGGGDFCPISLSRFASDIFPQAGQSYWYRHPRPR